MSDPQGPDSPKAEEADATDAAGYRERTLKPDMIETENIDTRDPRSPRAPRPRPPFAGDTDGAPRIVGGDTDLTDRNPSDTDPTDPLRSPVDTDPTDPVIRPT
jgi:hypothetical protein